jgi:uncharacterized RDD family membrane protein YckC
LSRAYTDNVLDTIASGVPPQPAGGICMSQTTVVALLLIGVMLAFDIADAHMSDGAALLLFVGWAYVAWQSFLRRVIVAGLRRVKSFELTYEGRPIDWWSVVVVAAFIGLYVVRSC